MKKKTSIGEEEKWNSYSNIQLSDNQSNLQIDHIVAYSKIMH